MTTKKEKVVAVNKVDTKKVLPELTEAQQAQQARVMRKRAADELVDYKKRIRLSNELKKLQVEELQLNIAYYNNKKEWMDLSPAMEALEAKEKAIQEKAMEDRRKEFEAEQKALKKLGDDEPETPKLISVGGGKPRSKQ